MCNALLLLFVLHMASLKKPYNFSFVYQKNHYLVITNFLVVFISAELIDTIYVPTDSVLRSN